MVVGCSRGDKNSRILNRGQGIEIREGLRTDISNVKKRFAFLKLALWKLPKKSIVYLPAPKCVMGSELILENKVLKRSLKPFALTYSRKDNTSNTRYNIYNSWKLRRNGFYRSQDNLYFRTYLEFGGLWNWNLRWGVLSSQTTNSDRQIKNQAQGQIKLENRLCLIFYTLLCSLFVNITKIPHRLVFV